MSFDKRINSFLAGSISVINAVVAIGYPALTALMSGILMGNLGPGGFSFVAFLGAQSSEDWAECSLRGSSAACWRC